MSSALISKLKTLLEKGGSEKKVEAYEDVIIEDVNEFLGEEHFYELPTNEIIKIVKKKRAQRYRTDL